MDLLFNDMPGGSVDIQTSTLELVGGGSSTGAGSTSNRPATLSFRNPYTFDTSTTITGTGTLEQDAYSSTLVLPGNYTFTGATSGFEGTLQVDGSLADSCGDPGVLGTLERDRDGRGLDGGAGGVSPGDGLIPAS